MSQKFARPVRHGVNWWDFQPEIRSSLELDPSDVVIARSFYGISAEDLVAQRNSSRLNDLHDDFSGYDYCHDDGVSVIGD